MDTHTHKQKAWFMAECHLVKVLQKKKRRKEELSQFGLEWNKRLNRKEIYCLKNGSVCGGVCSEVWKKWQAHKIREDDNQYNNLSKECG
jgi:hypothetical protein